MGQLIVYGLSLLEETCYGLSLLFLQSQSKGLCVAASSTNIGDPTLTLTQISVTLLINGINHQFFPNCGIVGFSLLNSSYKFSCALNFNSLKEVEFSISGYNASINDEWSTAVRVTIEHHCAEGIVTWI